MDNWELMFISYLWIMGSFIDYRLNMLIRPNSTIFANLMVCSIWPIVFFFIYLIVGYDYVKSKLI